MSDDQMAACFDLWMDRFMVNPSEFAREFEAVIQHERERRERREPTYGQACAAYMQHLAEALR